MLITHLLPLRKTGMGTILGNEIMVNGDGGTMDLGSSSETATVGAGKYC